MLPSPLGYPITLNGLERCSFDAFTHLRHSCLIDRSKAIVKRSLLFIRFARALNQSQSAPYPSGCCYRFSVKFLLPLKYAVLVKGQHNGISMERNKESGAI